MVKPVQHTKEDTTYSRTFFEGLCVKAGVARIIFMTDAARHSNPERTIKNLPDGAVIILRDYDHPERNSFASTLRQVCTDAGHLFLVAGDTSLARVVGADGVHLPEYMVADGQADISGFKLVTAACHSREAIVRAEKVGAHMAIVSPVFKTASHPEAVGLGVNRFGKLIENAPMPVVALGGINMKTAGALKDSPLAGIAGISFK